MKKINVYVAGSLFNIAEREYNIKVKHALTKSCKSFANILLPQEQCANLTDAFDIYAQCVQDINNSQVVVALLDGIDIDSGTAWELGYAFGTNTPTIGLRTDFRSVAEDAGLNAMIGQSINHLFTLDCLQKQNLVVMFNDRISKISALIKKYQLQFIKE